MNLEGTLVPGRNYGEILAFIAVAREKSFTRAAAHLGVSQSALSHTIRSLEKRLGIRLLTRTTRSVSTTDAGERLLKSIAQRLDAGVRFGEQVEKDMIAVRIGPDTQMAVVGAPEYLSGKFIPLAPQDLVEHRCINMRLPTYGGLYAWELEKEGREMNVRVDGQLVVNTVHHALNAAIEGFGLAFLPEDIVLPHIAEGRLVRVLEDWCPPFSGYHLYYPDRRRSSPAFSLVVDALRYRAEGASG